MKIIICPLIVALSAYILPNVNFTHILQPIIIGFVLAIAGTAMEYVFLRRGALWTSLFLDFIASIIIIYGMSLLMRGTIVTFMGAIIVALFLTIIEYFTHLYLIRSNKIQKSYA
jgi:hypothetical protein